MRLLSRVILLLFLVFLGWFIPGVSFGKDDDALRLEAQEFAGEGKFDNARIIAGTIQDKEKKKEAIKQINDEEAEKFWSVWGVGLIVNFDMGKRKPIKAATIVNGIVRVEEEDDVKYGIGLEVHRFVTGTTWGSNDGKSWSGGLAIGPYVSVLPGQNELLDVIGAGVKLAFIGGRSSKLSMNIAIGGYADPGTRVLGDDFSDGEPPPAGETIVRYKTVTQYGLQGVLSFSYDF